MNHSMPHRNPCRLDIHLAFTYIPHRSLERSVKSRTRTGSAFSTNESAWSVMVTGCQSRVWSGPNAGVKPTKETDPSGQSACYFRAIYVGFGMRGTASACSIWQFPLSPVKQFLVAAGRVDRAGPQVSLAIMKAGERPLKCSEGSQWEARASFWNMQMGYLCLQKFQSGYL